MKRFGEWHLTLVSVVVLAGLTFFGPTTNAAGPTRVSVQKGKVVLLEGAESKPLKAKLDLTPTIQVLTNGTFVVNQGKPRKLEEGQILDSDGMLLSPNGTLVPVVDHVVAEKGKVFVVRDGQRQVLQADMILPNGVRIKPDATMVQPNATLLRFPDGQIYKLDGSTLAAKDTITLRGGKVLVQKEGTQFEVARNRMLMMNEGTKVYGDGRVVKPSGETINLTEGQVVQVEGIILRKR